MSPAIEAALVTWWLAAQSVAGAEWTTALPYRRKDEHARIVTEERDARQALQDAIEREHGPKVPAKALELADDGPRCA